MNRVAALLTFAMITAVPAIAHHGWAGYSEEEFEISGTLETQVALAGPHGTMKIKVDGQIWDVTLAPPPRVKGAGLTSTTIPLGAKVTIHGHRHLDPQALRSKDRAGHVRRKAVQRVSRQKIVREALVWLEQSALGELMRTSSLWTYPAVNLLHIFGIAALFGAATIIDLRLLGVWRKVPLAAISDTAVPVSTAGFFLAASTGVGLLAANSTEYIGNPFLLIKFGAIVAGLINVALLNLSPAWQARRRRELQPYERRRLAVFGGVSLATWVTAVAAGRLIAYW